MSRSRCCFGRWRKQSVVLLLLLLTLLPPVVRSQQPTSSSKALDLEACYEALYTADSNEDRRVDSDEYVTFLQLFHPEVLDDDSAFTDLPLSLQSSFYTLACACQQESGNSDCCVGDNAHLSNQGTAPKETPTAAQETKLYRICFFTESTLDREFTPSPTRAPATPTTPTPITVTVSYVIVTANDTLFEDYEPDLVAAMNDLSVQLVGPQRRKALRASSSMPGNLRSRQLQKTIEEEAGQVKVELPTTILEVMDAGGFTMTPVTIAGIYTGQGPCPADLGDPSQDKCERIMAEITLILTGNDDSVFATALASSYQTTLESAILNGQLQLSLERVQPDSVVVVVSGQATSLAMPSTEAPTTTTTSDTPRQAPLETDGTGIGGGATAGIIIGAFCVVGVFGLFVVRRKQNAAAASDEQPAKETMIPVSGDDETNGQALESELISSKLGSVESSVIDMSLTHKLSSKELSNGMEGVATSSVDLGVEHPKQDDTVEQEFSDYSNGDETPVVSTPAAVEVDKKSSPPKSPDSEASESGWSTDDVYTASSMGTQDEDDNDSLNDDGEGMLTTQMIDLQAMEAASMEEKDNARLALINGGENNGVTNLADLEAAIMVGDWAAVGASAAALASSNYDSESTTDAASSRSNMSESATDEWKGNLGNGPKHATLDNHKAAELDQLIEKGDWEAVIQAAAKFEAEQQVGGESTVEKSYESSDDDFSSVEGGEDSTAATARPPGDNVTQGPSAAATTSNNGGDQEQENETVAKIRSDVIELLRRVVPEELESVDEMLAQFEGREEDLIDTLKAMEQRHQSSSSSPKAKEDSSLESSGDDNKASSTTETQ